MKLKTPTEFKGVLEDYSPYSTKPKLSEFEFDKLLETSAIIINSLKPIKEILKIDDENEEEKINSKKETAMKKIQKLRDENKVKEGKQENLIKDIIGLMYKGVLIKNIISIRKGKVYQYRCSYALPTESIIKRIKENLQEVSEKLSDVNLEILEFLIEKFENPYYIEQSNNEERYKDLEFDELHFVDEIKKSYGSSYGSNNDVVNIKKINGLRIDEDGSFNFFYKSKSDGKDKEKEFSKIDIETNVEDMFFLKFDKQITELAKDFIQELEKESELREKDIEEIKDKGKNLLMIKELQQGFVNGFGEIIKWNVLML